MAAVVETTVAAAVADAEDRFVRHHLAPLPGLRAWLAGGAVAAEQPDRVFDGHALWVVGQAADVGPLLAEVAVRRRPPARVLVDLGAAEALPATWAPAEARAWHWMWTADLPPEPRRRVEELTDHDELRGYLRRAYPDSFARPGDTDVECWLGVRDPSADPSADRSGAPVVAAGALVRRPDGTGYVRGVSVLAAYRGQGLARDVSAALTRRALEVGTGIATLGVFVDNEPALAVYRGLGYRSAHTFLSGVTSPGTGPARV